MISNRIKKTLLAAFSLLFIFSALSGQKPQKVKPGQLVPVGQAIMTEGGTAMYSPPKAVATPPSNARTTAVSPIMLGSSANAFSAFSPMANCVYANDSTDAVLFIHRQDPSVFGGVNGTLRYDLSTDGGFTFSNDIGLLNPVNINARYPQIAGYDPYGSTSATAGTAIFTADYLNGPFWGGIISGASSVVTSGSPVSIETLFNNTEHLPLGAMTEGLKGEYWLSRFSMSSGYVTDSLKIFKGTYTPGTQTIAWAFHSAKVMPWSTTFDGNPYALSPSMAFSPDGSIGWIATLGDLTAGLDSNMAPILIKSTDGGATWGNPQEIDLNGFPWVYDSLRALWVDSLANPVSSGRATAAFHYDLTVDAAGNPHMFFVIGSATTVADPDPAYSIYSGLAKYAVDLTSNNQGASFDLRLVAPILTFRGQFGGPSPLSMDNYPQISRTNDGQYIFYSWADSDTAQYTGSMNGIGFGVSDNLAPNLWISGLRLSDGYFSCIKGISALDLIWDGRALCPQMAPEVFVSGTGPGTTYNLPIVVSEMVVSDPNSQTRFHYFGGDALILESELAYAPGSGISWTGCTLNANVAANIQGKLYIDLNNNNVYDAGDVAMSNRVVGTTPISYADYTNATGDFDILCAVPQTYGLATYNFNPTVWTPSVPTVPYSLTVSTAGTILTGNDLAFRAISPIEDLGVTLVSNHFRPGFTSTAAIYVENLGTNMANGTLTLYFDSLVTYSSAIPAPTTVNLPAHTLTWTLPTVPIFGTQVFSVDFLTPITVPLATTLRFDAHVVSAGTDADLSNNDDSLSSIVIGAFDPNDKTAFPGGVGPNNRVDPGHDLSYRIRFQNTGTASAVNVTVRDTLDTDLLVTSFQVLGASHAYELRIERGNILVWEFNNINLPDSNANEPGSHGYIDFHILPKPGLPLGTVVENSASIYFDFNAPVLTNTARITYDVVSGVGAELAVLGAPEIRVYPHPAGEWTRVEFLRYAGRPWTFELLDLQGRVVRRVDRIAGESFLLERDGLRSGVYFYRVTAPRMAVRTGKIVFSSL